MAVGRHCKVGGGGAEVVAHRRRKKATGTVKASHSRVSSRSAQSASVNAGCGGCTPSGRMAVLFRARAEWTGMSSPRMTTAVATVNERSREWTPRVGAE